MSKEKSFDGLTPHEIDTMAACAQLVEGAHGTDQPRHLRAHLRFLEGSGHAQYQGAKGWRLTPSGRALRDRFLSVGKAARKAQEKKDHE